MRLDYDITQIWVLIGEKMMRWWCVAANGRNLGQRFSSRHLSQWQRWKVTTLWHFLLVNDNTLSKHLGASCFGFKISSWNIFGIKENIWISGASCWIVRIHWPVILWSLTTPTLNSCCSTGCQHKGGFI